MRFSAFLTFAAVLGIVFGVGFLLAPVTLLAQYGVDPSPATVLMSRFFAAALLNLGLLLYLIRHVKDGLAQKAVAFGGVVGSLAGLFVAVLGQISHVINSLGWSTVVIYALLLLGYALFAFGSTPAAEP